MTTETFSPQVIVDGVTVTPEGWMWVLGFALRGVPWAVEAASKPEFTARVADYRRREKLYWAEREEAALAKRLDETRAQIAALRGAA